MRTQCMALLTSALFISSPVWAATPEQAGDYAGTITTKNVSSTGGKTTAKKEFLFSLALDNSTTVTIGGISDNNAIFLEGNEGLIEFAHNPPVNGVSLATLHFKKGTIKGVAAGAEFGPPIVSATSKIKLKKIN